MKCSSSIFLSITHTVVFIVMQINFSISRDMIIKIRFCVPSDKLISFFRCNIICICPLMRTVRISRLALIYILPITKRHIHITCRVCINIHITTLIFYQRVTIFIFINQSFFIYQNSHRTSTIFVNGFFFENGVPIYIATIFIMSIVFFGPIHVSSKQGRGRRIPSIPTTKIISFSSRNH